MDSDGNFDFNFVLKRFFSYGCILEVVKFERIFSRFLVYKYKFIKIVGFFIKDLVVSEFIGLRFGFEVVKIKGDGNCLFNFLFFVI